MDCDRDHNIAAVSNSMSMANMAVSTKLAVLFVGVL